MKVFKYYMLQSDCNFTIHRKKQKWQVHSSGATVKLHIQKGSKFRLVSKKNKIWKYHVYVVLIYHDHVVCNNGYLWASYILFWMTRCTDHHLTLTISDPGWPVSSQLLQYDPSPTRHLTSSHLIISYEFVPFVRDFVPYLSLACGLLCFSRAQKTHVNTSVSFLASSHVCSLPSDSAVKCRST